MPELSLNTSIAGHGNNLRAVRGLFRENRALLVAVARTFDLVLIGASLWLVLAVSGVKWSEYYSLAVACSAGLFLLFAQSQDIYRSWRGASLQREAVHVWVAWLGVALGLLALAFLSKVSDEYSRRAVLSWFLVAPSVLTLWRAQVHAVTGALRKQGLNTRRVAIVGARELGVKLADTISSDPAMGLRVMGFYDDRRPAGSRPLQTKNYKVLGNLETLLQRAREGSVDVIYITLPLRAEQRIQELIAKLSDTTVSVYMVPDFFMYSLLHTSWGAVGDLPTVSIHETPFYGVDGWMKRLEDIVLSSLILALIAIPMLIIAAGVRVSSPGPVIFKQRRYGLQGQQIEVWKFRSMTVCENGDSVCQATKDDARITPFGAFLRRTSLDELPQFINVLQGRMSIVGPRPHAVAHNEQYRKLISGYMLRHKVKPGITGWAQINGWRGETETLDKMQGRIEHDLAYIRDWSMWLDLKIVFLTVFKGFTGKNAY
jgi:putative colanic acid biosynthesis UDP-glucose lipid carrier transferase